MADDAEIEARFWKDLKASPFVMLGLHGARDGHTQPMAAKTMGDHGPIWFFTTTDNTLVRAMGDAHRAIAAFVSKGHDLFASIHGELVMEKDRSKVDELWDSSTEAWFDGGKDDPRLCLVRLDTDKAELWKGGSSFGAAIEKLLGKDPKNSYQDNIAKVTL